MRKLHARVTTTISILMILIVSSSLTSAESRSMPIPGDKFVNVSVAFTMELPLADESQQALVTTQMQGRELIYEFAKGECAVLKRTLADACRLTNLQVSNQVRRQQGQMPVIVYLNGNAQFAITLRELETEEQ